MNGKTLCQAVVVAVAVGLVGASFPVRVSRVSVDRVTGSMKVETTILFVYRTGSIDTSDLERWIVAHEGHHAPDWKHLSTITSGLRGVLSRGCSNAPPIYKLRPAGLVARFVRGSTDGELAAFVRLMRDGTEAEQEQAVEAALVKTIDVH